MLEIADGIGEALRTSFPHDQDEDGIDDRMTMLMLQLSIDPPPR